MFDFLDHPDRLTGVRYFQMVDAGILGKRDPIYLWKGRLVEKAKKERLHSVSLSNLKDLMIRIIPGGWHVEQGAPLAVGEDCAPEPDLSVIRGSLRDYPKLPPTAQDVALIVEVSGNSLAFDLGEVLEAYAAQAIPIYWVVNLPANRFEVRTEPTGPVDQPSYRNIQFFGPDDEVPVVIDGREVGRIAVKDVLP